MKRKPRLPDRLLEEMAEHKGDIGKRQKRERNDSAGGRKKIQSSRKTLRSAKRQEKKRKKQENRTLYLKRRSQQRKTQNRSNQHGEHRVTSEQNTGAENSAKNERHQSADRCENEADGENQEQKGEGACDVEEARGKGTETDRLAREMEEEKKGIKKVAKKLGLSAESTEEESLNLNGLLDGFDDDGANALGIPEMESPSESDSEGERLEANKPTQQTLMYATDRGLNALLSNSEGAAEDGNEELSDEDPVQEDLDSTTSSASSAPSLQPCVEPTGVYVPPALRNQAAPISSALNSKKEAIDRRVRGLINRLSEDNIKGIANELVKMHSQLSRSLVSAAISAEITKALAEGPRATAQFVGIAAALISAVCTLANSHEISATFLSSCAQQMESCYQKEDSLGTYNTLSMFSHLYLCSLATPQLLFGLLHHLTARFQELDVGMTFRLLETCGLKLRSDDPAAMKEFVIAVHNKAAQLSSAGHLSQKAELMLDLVIDVKNNRLSKTGKRESFNSLSPAVGKWLRQIEVQKMALLHLTWNQIKAPNLKGPWWLPDTQKEGSPDLVSDINLGTLSHDTIGTELLSLASQQRMNTEVRKTVFCVIMGAQDVLDACEKLLRLPLKGEQDREIIRVLVDCCLQEAKWNPFYSAVAKRLSRSKKSHVTTLKFCLLNKLKVLDEMNVRSLDHLARMMASVLHSDVLPLGMLKGVDLSPSLSEKALFFWRIFLIHFLLSYNNSKALTESIFRLSHSEELVAFSKKLLVFIQYHFANWVTDHRNVQKIQCSKSQATLVERCNAIESSIKQLNMK